MTRRERRAIRFFPDESALSVAYELETRGYTVLSYSDVGLEINKRVSDEKVAEHVRNAGGAIIITKNPRHFKLEAGLHAQKTDRGECQMSCGIVQIPHEMSTFDAHATERKLILRGGTKVDWNDVRLFNWLVVVHRDDKVDIRELARCAHCKHEDCPLCDEIDAIMLSETDR
jgi:hypothetical protein